MNTPRLITDANGNAVWNWGQDEPFGGNLPNQDPNGTGNQFVYNPRFPGQYFDKETNLHYNYFRDYDPATGRYIESDPIGLRGGLNTYAYANNVPTMYIDPFGLRALTEREKACLKPYIPQIDLDNADLHDGEVPPYLMKGYDGITRGNDIYFRPGVYDGSTAGGIGILGHELYHVGQYREGATWLNFAWEGRNGHDESSLEKPAIALEMQIKKNLQDANGNADCECKK